jgi:hypothetical protein
MGDIAAEISTFVEAELNYLVPTGERPATYTYEPPAGVPLRSGVYRGVHLPIANARVAPPPGGATLDSSGFELRRQASALKDFSDQAAIASVYYSEAEQLLKNATGADKVVIFDHTLRDGTPGHGVEGVREPVRYIHNDQTFVSGPRRVQDHLPAQEALDRWKRRFAIVNLWRPIGNPAISSPLALCDSRSIALDDLVPSDLIYRDKVGETYAFVFNPQHRWYYFPNVTPEEYLLLKIYDSSSEPGTSRLTAHTAFDDPTTPFDAPPRRSIELRALVFF